jgi:alpha-1,2-mannosyltransferase
MNPPRWARIALAAVSAAAAAYFLVSVSRHGIHFGRYRIDLDVYRIGGRAWLDGRPLYGPLPPTRAGIGLPFSYPPAAAVALAPLALVPMTVAGTGLTLATMALVAVVLGVFLRRLGGPGWLAAWLLPLALFLEPVRATMHYGQVNVVLMALVSLDCLAAAPRWPRGALTGVAAAMKLTPAAFVLFFLLRRDYRAAATAGLAFAAVTGAGFALAPADSARYWTSVVLAPGRAGNPIYAANQCLAAVLARAGLAPGTTAETVAWLALSAVVLALATRGMRRALAAGEDCWALCLNALAALLISPVSWSHHWVWCVPVLLTLASLSRRSGSLRDDSLRQGGRRAGRARTPAVLAVLGLAGFAAGPQWWLPNAANRELGWALWQQAAGSYYVLFAVLVLAWSAARPAPPLVGVMLDHRVRGREESALAAVLPPDQVGRRPVLAVHLRDLAVAIRVALMPSLDRQLVPDLRLHGDRHPCLDLDDSTSHAQ